MDGSNWSHLKFDFLKPEKVMDAKKRRPSDPDYDPRTLYVPDDFLKNQTPVSSFCVLPKLYIQNVPNHQLLFIGYETMVGPKSKTLRLYTIL